MKVRVELFNQMAGDHGCHAPGSIVRLPVPIARQIVAARQGRAIDRIPGEDEGLNLLSVDPTESKEDDEAEAVAEVGPEVLSPAQEERNPGDLLVNDWGVEPTEPAPSSPRRRRDR